MPSLSVLHNVSNTCNPMHTVRPRTPNSGSSLDFYVSYVSKFGVSVWEKKFGFWYGTLGYELDGVGLKFCNYKI